MFMMCVHVQECMNGVTSELYRLHRSRKEPRTVVGKFKLQFSLEEFAPLLDCRHCIVKVVTRRRLELGFFYNSFAVDCGVMLS